MADGVIVSRVMDDGPAQWSGIKTDDRIIKVSDYRMGDFANCDVSSPVIPVMQIRLSTIYNM